MLTEIITIFVSYAFKAKINTLLSELIGETIKSSVSRDTHPYILQGCEAGCHK